MSLDLVVSPGPRRARVRKLGRLPASMALDVPALPRDRLELGQMPPAPAIDPKLGEKVLTSAAAAATTADKVATGQARPGTRAAGVAQAVIPVATAIAEASGDKDAVAVVKNTADASTAVVHLQGAGSHFVQAAEKIRDGAAPVAGATSSAASGANALSSFGRLAAGLEVTRGVLVAPQLAEQVKLVADDPAVLKNPGFSQSLAGNSIAAANGFIGAARLFNRTGFAARLSPWAGIAADVTLLGATASEVGRKGWTLPTAVEATAYAADMVGNGLLIAGGNPAGLVLKGASLGLQAAALGLRHKGDIAKAARNAASAVKEKVADLA